MYGQHNGQFRYISYFSLKKIMQMAGANFLLFLHFQFQVADSNKIPKYVCIYVLRECCLRCKLGGYACTTYGHLQSLHCFLFQSKNIASMHACAVHTICITRPMWIYVNPI